MKYIYTIGIYFFAFLMKLISPFHNKAKLWVRGRKGVLKQIESDFSYCDKEVIWIHVSSLGEFEQGRPVIESIKRIKPDVAILITFFSPSGYEVCKDYDLADFTYYLPVDTPHNAKQFFDIVNPSMVFFVKYDFWYNYLHESHIRSIPTYLFSAVFRKEQLFFKPYGVFYRNILDFFTTIFVQDNASAALLEKFGFSSVVIAGDTRVDRVISLADNVQDIAYINDFKKDKLLIVAGSTWHQGEALFASYLDKHSPTDYKVVFAPHEVGERHISQLIKCLKNKGISCIRYSTINEKTKLDTAPVLIIDSIGLLSSLYKYADIVYIGGGFGKGIHNTLEPATFGLPIIFGKKYHKFHEAVFLCKKGGAFSINNFHSFEKKLTILLQDSEFRAISGAVSRSFILDQSGSTDIIVNYCL